MYVFVYNFCLQKNIKIRILKFEPARDSYFTALILLVCTVFQTFQQYELKNEGASFHVGNFIESIVEDDEVIPVGVCKLIVVCRYANGPNDVAKVKRCASSCGRNIHESYLLLDGFEIFHLKQ